MKKTLSVIIIASLYILLSSFFFLNQSYAGPQSTTYELEEYGFGAGGIQSGSSTNYSIFGTAGELDNGSIDSSSYTLGNGLTFTMQANVPPAPTFTNPASNYDRLKFVLATGGNPSDATFAIAISSDNFVTTKYVQSDLTVGTTLGPEDWQTYSAWGGTSGSVITGLLTNTTYKIKAKAEHGDYTESGWGPTASAATIDSTLTFGVDSASVTFSNLGPSNSYTDSSKTTVLTTSTNAYSGYIVYGRDTQPLTKGSDTIGDYSSSNAAPTSWSGTGFGYSSDDSNLTGGTANRFTSGGPKYAGFGITAPGDPVADHDGPITTPITNEQFTISYRVTGDVLTKPGTYSSTVVYTVVPTY